MPRYSTGVADGNGYRDVVISFSFDALRRWPDVEADNLFAADAADRLVLDEAATALKASAPGEVVVVGDNYGALTLGATALHSAADIRVHQDALSGELAIARNAEEFGLDESFRAMPLGTELLDGARVVLLRLPRSLDALDEIAGLIAEHAAADVTIYAGGMIKHLALAMNEVLGRYFGQVRPGLARQKARVLTVSGISAGRVARNERIETLTGNSSIAVTARRPGLDTTAPSSRSTRPAEQWPQREFHADLGLWVCAHGGAFAGTRVDIGTRFLLSVLHEAKPDATSAIDLGCGTGVLASALAMVRPGISVTATDQSAAAVASARATMEANGVAGRVRVVRDDGLATQPNASAELILLNPPFHVGSAVHTGIDPGSSPTRPGCWPRAASSGRCSTRTSAIGRRSPASSDRPARWRAIRSSRSRSPLGTSDDRSTSTVSLVCCPSRRSAR